MQNFPNPVNTSTSITYFIPGTGNAMLYVYNINGNLVSKLVDGIQTAGFHTCRFEPTDLPGGIYTYTLRWKGVILSGKMLVIK
jgi:hypothetical protein